jgi:hypothetical protein
MLPHILLRTDRLALSGPYQWEIALPGMLLHLDFVPAAVGQINQGPLAVPL